MDLIRASCHYCGYNPDGDTTIIIIKSIILPPLIKITIIIIIMLFFLRKVLVAMAMKPSYSKLCRKSVKVLINEVLRMYLFTEILKPEKNPTIMCCSFRTNKRSFNMAMKKKKI